MVGIFGNPLVPRNMSVLPWSISTSSSKFGRSKREVFGMKFWSFYIDKVLSGDFVPRKISRYQVTIQV